MYQFSRSIYRELSEDVIAPPCAGRSNGESNRAQLLKACEASLERLAEDHHYFAHPARTLFRDVRDLFPLTQQLRVYHVIEKHMQLAREFVEEYERQGMKLDGSPLECHASTRRGTPCRRVPLPSHKYCPSHRHLEEPFEVEEQVVSAA